MYQLVDPYALQAMQKVPNLSCYYSRNFSRVSNAITSAMAKSSGDGIGTDRQQTSNLDSFLPA